MLSEKVRSNLKNASFIRAMFEEGEKLRAIHGPENVFDFSLGNPDYEPPESVLNSLRKHLSDSVTGLHKYMNNAGFSDVRSKIADQLKLESALPFNENHIVMTVGAAGGLNVVLKSLLNPGEEVIVFSPYFVEYVFYVDNHGGKTVFVPTDHKSFEPDLNALEKSITPKCKAVIINSPNNPTGVVYSKELIIKLGALIEKKEQEFGISIMVISDEPYTKIVYDNIEVPNVLSLIKNSVVVNSYSKSLALPGERIGFIAISPRARDVKDIISAMVFTNRTLGYVNAPATYQKVIGDTFNQAVNTEEYKKRRDFLYENLTSLGFECVKPHGAFYLFPKSLIEDDKAFAKHAQKYNLLIVPGSGFGCPGHFRLAYCISFESIKKSITAFKSLAEDFR